MSSETSRVPQLQVGRKVARLVPEPPTQLDCETKALDEQLKIWGLGLGLGFGLRAKAKVEVKEGSDGV